MNPQKPPEAPEISLLIIKPDAMQKGLQRPIIERLQQEVNGFAIRHAEHRKLKPEELSAHYVHIMTQPFYPELEKFMSSSEVLAMVVEGPVGVVEDIRRIVGPTRAAVRLTELCDRGEHQLTREERDEIARLQATIRGQHGHPSIVMQNVIHASDSPVTGRQEVERFFPEVLQGIDEESV